ncbi:hypothetical protein NAEGRDRAFT_54263 [Naegleria gruberi]|uniref:F-box domain-containing protein n=1 Tax=Naegleria gruberi TaxID=5762 RepID=D2W2S9_NAEGR|nr:uncharacterized protein NAEGRDRAFT_54263 [Naegleria gruberi]EFC36567.1 hypothetical protein NAEGRDRAFT_54263 [Naegleria gruberi]|eukprot:XP_002669311.1 hypothetical protein NAEGRDRAFT_54263 [Naegleria gruberi strain NEG-M]
MGNSKSRALGAFSPNHRGDRFDDDQTNNNSSSPSRLTTSEAKKDEKPQLAAPSEQLKFITESYESFNRVFFGEEFLNDGEVDNSSVDSKLILPIELIRVVLDYCDQKELQAMLTSCKLLYNILRMDMYYWPQITKYQTFGQLVKYLESHDLLLHTELYTNVGQALHYTDLSLPVMDIKRKTEFKLFKGENSWSLNSTTYSALTSKNWEHPDRRGTCSQLFAEEYVRDDIYDMDILNLMVNTLFKLRLLVQKYKVSTAIPTRVVPNLRMALRDYRNFFHSHPRLKLLLSARERENMEMNGPIELESREDELPKPIDNSLKLLSENDFGKPIAYSCVFCNSKVGGFTCVKCNELLLINSLEGTAKCPNCSSSIQRPNCCQKEMQPQAIDWTIHPSTTGPQFPCKCSAIACRCFACCSKDSNPEGSKLTYNHFYRRVWEADVYTCSARCKGQYYDGAFSCGSCKSTRGLIMVNVDD